MKYYISKKNNILTINNEETKLALVEFNANFTGVNGTIWIDKYPISITNGVPTIKGKRFPTIKAVYNSHLECICILRDGVQKLIPFTEIVKENRNKIASLSKEKLEQQIDNFNNKMRIM